jgi:hypothetical protein
MMHRLEPDAQWAARQCEGLPASWRRRLLARWDAVRADFNPARLQAEGNARRKANLGLVNALAGIDTAPLPLDASDADICAAADRFVLDCVAAREEAQQYESGRQRAELAAICAAIGVAPPDGKRYEDEGAILRMLCPAWWRRNLRKAQAKAAEGTAISLGYVSRKSECYASDEAVQRRLQQNARNAAMLENTLAVNEDGDEYTLAELVARSVSDKTIRRAELMTRISGFERVAIDMGHSGIFFTMTCPTEMHAYRTVYGKAVRNKKYREIRPTEAQAHLSAVWARIRAALARHGVKLYGFRIAEPQHDSTPHWHCLMFHDAQWPGDTKRATQPRLWAIIRRYSLAIPGDEAPDMGELFKQEYERIKLTPYRFKKTKMMLARQVAEQRHHDLSVAHRARQNAQPGAKVHRVDFKPMDPAKGTAAGYIAKYVAKNIDGYRLEKDLYGNDSIEASARVEAWATQWRIRQFQQVGGPPVTVWRELRRIKTIPADVPKFVKTAHEAVNRVAVLEGRDNASVAWHRYVEAQGGVFCGRGYRVRLATVSNDAAGRYGDAAAPRPVGIEYFQEHRVRDALGNWTDIRPMTVTIESERHQWEIIRAGTSTGARRTMVFTASSAPVAGGHFDHGVEGLNLGLKRTKCAPWTRVNNCTQGVKNGADEGKPGVGRDSKEHQHAENRRGESAARGREPLADGQGHGPASTGRADAHSRPYRGDLTWH